MKQKQRILVIVESPSKAKTINKYLGNDYIISSSVGHIIDLPKSRLAIDVENDFKPEYITIRGKAKVLNELKKYASDASMVLLATDPDREGEAISWHLSNALSSRNPNIRRIEFNEITEAAVKQAVAHPRDINEDLVKAQQARRILDRLVGYYISPILWKKVKRGLSAGRVQSVALKVICEREKDIDSFIPVEFWTIDLQCSANGQDFIASLHSKGEEKIRLKDKSEIEKIISTVNSEGLRVTDIKLQERKRKPQAPYITSKLQQDAANRLGFTSQKTMMVAQQLYEGINITGEGPVGLITYMRTDSTRISDSAIKSVRDYVLKTFDADYLPEVPNTYRNKKGAQDAHEAIRPTDVNRTPDSIKGDITRDQYRLYELIWKRFVTSQMNPEISEITTVSMNSGDYLFRSTGSRVLFKGFTVLDKTEKTERQILPKLKNGDTVEIKEIKPEQHFTTPPPRFNDASLVKFLEESGIGRPSTYAPTISTLMKRYYVTHSGKQLVPTVLGKIVNEIMIHHFPGLVNEGFTADMENELDLVEEGKLDPGKMLHEFYDPFQKTVADAEKNISEMKNVLDEQTDIVCEQCGNMMVKKLGKYGFFLACTGFPACRNAKPLSLGKCPKCDDGEVVKRSAKSGRGTFYSCTRYPSCDFLSRDVPADKPCPKCGKLLFLKRIKGRGEELNCLNSQCDFRMELLDDTGGDLPDHGA